MGLTLGETMTLPLCELLDLISVHQIKEEGFAYRSPESDRSELLNLFTRK